MKVVDIYIDNGFSGTNFERPAFQKMMEDAKRGKINCIIVKDLSRFGRSYLEAGNYLEKIFPFLNIRFISVTDHFDTFAVISSEDVRGVANGIEIPLKNIINEVYAKDISRKVGSAIEIQKREGRYGGGVAPYGYKKSSTVKGKYEVDEEAAEVVRYIFRLRSEGYGYCSIVKILNEKGIKSPSAYRYEKGIVRNEKGSNVLWKIYAIEDMLRDEVYLGNMVRGKTHSAMHKGEKRHYVPRAEWVIVPGTHEPIVSKELFEAVQAVNEKKAQEHKDNLEKAKENPKRDNLFKGKIFCGDCGITMGGAVGNYNSMSYYCPNYRENGAMGCVKKHISARKLQVEIRAGDIVGYGVGFVVPLGIIGALGHLAQVPGPGHTHFQVLRQHIRTQRHAVLGIVHVLHLQRIVPGPNHGTEHGGIFAGGDNHFEHGSVHRTAQIIQPSGQHLENVTIAHSAKVDLIHSTGGSHRRQNTGDAVILCHLGHSGQINDPEGHYFLL